ncbi:phosphatase PAP2 family protein [Calditrichota bacterium LG25]
MKLKFFVLIVSVWLALAGQASAQKGYLSVFKEDFYQSLTIGNKLAGEMVTPTAGKIGLTLGILALTVTDEAVIDFFRNHQTETNDRIFSIDRIHGEKNVLFPAAFVLYAYGLFSGNSAVRQSGLKSGQAMFYSGLIVITLKEVFGRGRPHQNYGAFTFRPFSFAEGWRSFPSGHAALSFAFSTVMAGSMESIWWKGFWYSSAALVAGARMYHDKHWLSDVVAGGLIGWSVGRFVLNYPKKGEAKSSLKIFPFFKTEKYTLAGLAFSFRIR